MFSDQVQKRLLLAMAFFVILFATVRAGIQSMTFDEAWTYRNFGSSLRGVGIFDTNNHVLNSLLIWMATSVFGNNHITVRLPALLGAAFYVCISYFACLRLSERFGLRWALFVCLTCNPLILGFMVAARGYSLANAFLLGAVSVPVFYRPHQGYSLSRLCALASLALGFSFTANYSFAFVGIIVWLAILLWAMRYREEVSSARILAVCTLPGLLVALLICGYPLAHWPVGQWKDDLWWGAHSLKEMKESLTQSTLFQLTPSYHLGPMYKRVRAIKSWLLPVLGIVCLCRFLVLAGLALWRRRVRESTEVTPNETPAWYMIAILVATLVLSIGISWLAFHFYGLPLPLGRTGIYVVSLCTLLAGVIAAMPSRDSISLFLGRFATFSMVCLACYFLLCLRVSYFREYQFNADIKPVYAVLQNLHHRYGITDFEVTSTYVTALNYYRERAGDWDIPEFKLDHPEFSHGRTVYALDGAYWRDFVRKEKLRVIYKAPFSEAVVAVSPGVSVPGDVYP